MAAEAAPCSVRSGCTDIGRGEAVGLFRVSYEASSVGGVAGVICLVCMPYLARQLWSAMVRHRALCNVVSVVMLPTACATA
mmetsp:Transcript_25306/g.52923  ORF Transcript_25306/g.52923 Transcript_25306/m.52923 type:complete len:81 (+) Transcript_25306:39-281(+)|eukprot:796246-Pleurochrysis_carterae.AAC.3